MCPCHAQRAETVSLSPTLSSSILSLAQLLPKRPVRVSVYMRQTLPDTFLINKPCRLASTPASRCFAVCSPSRLYGKSTQPPSSPHLHPADLLNYAPGHCHCRRWDRGALGRGIAPPSRAHRRHLRAIGAQQRGRRRHQRAAKCRSSATRVGIGPRGGEIRPRQGHCHARSLQLEAVAFGARGRLDCAQVRGPFLLFP